MPEQQIKTLLELGLFNALLGLVGGGVRISLGLAPNESLLKEIARILFVAMPFGWLAGGIAVENQLSEYTTFSAAVFTGLIAHNIAKAAMDIGIAQIIKTVFKR
ncbi:MAG: hypothetical protein JKX87_06265 [Cycloclasticus sp.]|nr:hypothetical protein [Cycloclasticus sp.]